MRQNLPITEREHRLAVGTTLVSVTDLQGRIVYANAAFVEASGFTRDELLGQPHNVIRHPDVPAEAFRDLWATLKAGQPWLQIVKNRRKNGDHYWVQAHAIPVRSEGRIVGYMSVRTTPSRDEVAGAQALYARLKAEGPDGTGRIGLREGEVVRRDLVGRALLAAKTGVSAVGPSGLACAVAASAIAIGSTYLPPSIAVPLSMVAAAVGLSVVRHIEAAPLRRVLRDAQQLASGDLTHRIDWRGHGIADDLGRTLQQLSVNLRSVIDDVRIEAQSVRGAVDEIAAGNHELAVRTDAQASSLEQTASATEEIHGTVQHSAASAQEGTRLAAEAAAAARRSHEGVLGVVQAMEAINDSSRRIGEIIGVIEGVAFQTNILALNAAVEAARAGEQGRGFAVVAGEVRALAHRTTEAAREIKGLITESSGRVAVGRAQTAEARDRMQGALTVVDEVSRLLEQIGHASSEQQLGVGQVNEAVTSLDTITQHNAAMVEELSAAAQSLVAQVQEVNLSMSVFKLKDGDRSVADADAVALRREADARAGQGRTSFEPHDAVAAHVNWKTRLRNAALRGTVMDAEQIARDDCCPLGRWLHGEGRGRWAHRPAFTALVDRHAEFHGEAATVARLVNAQRSDEALARLGPGTDFARSTQATVLAIRRLHADMDQDPADRGEPSSPDARAAQVADAALARARSTATAAPPPRSPTPSPKGALAAKPAALSATSGPSGGDDWETF